MSFLDIFKSPEKRLENQIEGVFNRAIKNAFKNSGGDSMLAGVLVFHAIATAYDTLRHDNNLRIASGMSIYEYEQCIERIKNKVGRKNISNWDQMMAGNREY